MNKSDYKKLAQNVFWIALLITFIYLLNSIDKQVLENIALRLGWLGPLFIGLILICTHVFAPISGTAFYFLGIRLYGYESIAILFYFTSMISATICFFIARKWGRGIVIKLVGEKTMVQIDDIVLIHERSILIIGRLLGYYFFEFISYALGLTTISFKKYISYTAGLTLIPALILYFIFRNLDFNSFQNSMIYYGSIIITGIAFAYLFGRLVQKGKVVTINKK